MRAYRIFMFFILLISFGSKSREDFFSLQLNLSGGMQIINVVNSNGNMYFSGILDSKYNKLIGSREQIYPLKNNVSNYPHYSKSDIDFSFYLVNNKNGFVYPFFNSEFKFSPKIKRDNSLVIVTTQEDNKSYFYLLKYDIYEGKNILLSNIYRIDYRIGQENFDVSAYVLKMKIPSNIKNLNQYDRKIMSKFIVNTLYHKRDEIKIDLISKSENKNVKRKNLCSNDDDVIFSCTLSNKKMVSVCKYDDSVGYYYRYGVPSYIEMSFGSKEPNEIKWRGEKKSNFQFDSLYFNIGNFEYSVNQKLQYSPANIKSSVIVSKDGNVIFDKSCKERHVDFDTRLENKIKYH